MATGFQVDQLQLPRPIIPGQVDWRPLGEIGDTIAAARQKQQLADALASATDASGNIDPAKAGAAAASIGDPRVAAAFLGLAQHGAALKQSAAQHAEILNVQREHYRNQDTNNRLDRESKESAPVVLKRTNPDTGDVEEYLVDRRAGTMRAPNVVPPVDTPAPAPVPTPAPQRQSSFNERFPGPNGVPPEEALPPGATLAQGQGVPSIPMQPASRQPGVDIKTQRQEYAKKIVGNEEDTVKSARAAADLKPLVDKLVDTYEKLIASGGIGPVVGSDYGPRQAQALFHGADESLRQQYDTALKAVQARIVAAQNKGEGSVSNFERLMYAQQFPNLTASDPAAQLGFLKQLQETTGTTINAAKGTKLGNQPGVVLDRPAIKNQFSPSAKIPMGAAQKLIADPSDDNRRYFDETFGDGAARAVLKR